MRWLWLLGRALAPPSGASHCEEAEDCTRGGAATASSHLRLPAGYSRHRICGGHTKDGGAAGWGYRGASGMRCNHFGRRLLRGATAPIPTQSECGLASGRWFPECRGDNRQRAAGTLSIRSASSGRAEAREIQRVRLDPSRCLEAQAARASRLLEGRATSVIGSRLQEGFGGLRTANLSL